MNPRIAGMGWVTPLGRDLNTVWELLLNGAEAKGETISNGSSGKEYPLFPVPPVTAKNLPPHARLRRSSAISRFAAAAGLDALEQARHALGVVDLERTALVFAVSNGGVIYTKRFYHDIVVNGAGAASPLLFPETVFNAPASHLAAILGITGASYTLVGDGAVGISALQMATDLISFNKALDYCLVVGAEEADWLLCDAYHRWRLLKNQPPVDLFSDPPRGMILSEGAGAILVGREGALTIDLVHPGAIFTQRSQVRGCVSRVISDLDDGQTEIVVSSANGTFVDLEESAALIAAMPEATVYTPKGALGESVGASAIWQVIVAGQALRTNRLPPLHMSSEQRLRTPGASAKTVSGCRAVVLSCSLNHQINGLRLSK
jgi:3-oxoacyl-[acyl-carrier-protein] synthase II